MTPLFALCEAWFYSTPCPALFVTVSVVLDILVIALTVDGGKFRSAAVFLLPFPDLSRQTNLNYFYVDGEKEIIAYR